MKMRLHKKISRLLRRKIRTSVMSEYGAGILARTKNGLFIVEAGDFSVGRQLLRTGQYDFDSIQWLKACLHPHVDNIIIVGTHIGTLLVPFSHICTQIIGYEADQTNFDLLQLNITLNGVNNADVHLCAIGESAQTVHVKRNILNTGNTSIAVNQKHADNNDNNDNSVKMITLDNATTVDVVDLIIMDIEGHELHALKGGAETLGKTQKLYIEFAPEQLREHGTDPTELLDMLAQQFEHLYMFDGAVHAYSSQEGSDIIRRDMEKKGYLKNILYCKQALNEQALNFTVNQ